MKPSWKGEESGSIVLGQSDKCGLIQQVINPVGKELSYLDNFSRQSI